MLTTTVELANHALTAIGADRIAALTEDTESARTANLYYEQARDVVLRSYPFATALRRAELARVADDGLSDYDYKFALPANNLKLRELFDSSGDELASLDTYVLEGQHVRCNVSAVQALYITNNLDVRDMPDYLSIAIAYKLASMMAFRLTAGMNIKGMVDQEFARAIAEAKIAEGWQQPWRGAATSWDPYGTDASDY